MGMENNLETQVGRPTVITDDVVLKLVASFQRGLSVSTACQFAKIGRKAFYDRYNKDTEFRNRIDDAKDFSKHLAGDQVFDVLQDVTRKPKLKLNEQGQVMTDDKGRPVYEFGPKYSEIARINVAKWYLERKESDEFGAKNSFAGNVNNNNQNNYFFIDDGKFRELSERAGIKDIPKAELIEAVTSRDMGRSDSEGSVVELH